MCKARLTEHQNIAVIKLVEAGRTVKDICQEADICEVTDSLADSGMHIVLISDRSLTPLANYWILKSNKIQGIIYSDDDDIVQQQKMHRLFTGRLANSKRGRTLNYTEFILLKRFVSGISIQQIVNIDNIDIKKLYVHKLRLENKLGHSIHKIISNIL